MSAKLYKLNYMAKFEKIMPMLLCIIFILFSFKINPHYKKTIQTIVIDAGHGGHDAGCAYHGAKEKDITLKIALELGKKLEYLSPDLKIIYTRTTDKFIPLYDRALIANKANADLFISIHCNSSKRAEVSGTETYAMGLHKADENVETAKRENDVILMEENYLDKYEGFDPNSPETHIYFSLFQNAFLDQSILLASKIESSLSKKTNTNSRGVKQAGFLVLWKTKMPSVLVEVGFLSNLKDKALLTSSAGVNQISQNIADAVIDYKKVYESGNY